jgi:hypothetical protein
MAILSDAMVCGYDLVRRRIAAWLPDRRIDVLPVFSNVGEVTHPLPMASREPVAVVFGGPRRSRVYGHDERPCAGLLDRLAIDRILDIGPATAVPSRFSGRPVEALGVLPSAEVSARLAIARVGLADYPRHVAAKSGILAAYHAHGVLCVNLTERGEPSDGLHDGETYLGRQALAEGDPCPERVATAGHAWYRTHDLAGAASLFASRLCHTVSP